MDVFNLVAKITLDSSEYEQQVGKIAQEADSGGGGWGGKVAKGLGGIAKGGAIAFGAVATAASAAAVAIGKSALDGYAEYEQLEGGVKKLFGESASKQVMKYAQDAYKTAGMSANEYMETATSFSASLISSLGGDTKKAAEVADIAMRSMSDNVNTFGGDIEGVKTAYQGFAKQNYTMLDNLKLGYGGTKTEMERLIKDANKYRKAQGKNADLTIDSFADIVEAIQTVQEEQGIAGTTAKESMTTIEGSANATKAAWKNVVTAIAGGGDLKQAMSGLVSSLFGNGDGGGLVNQIIPRIKTIMEGIGDFVAQAAPLIAQKLPELISAILPSLLTAVGSLIKALATAIPGLLKGIWDSIKAVAPILMSTVKDLVSKIPSALGDIISNIGSWISSNAGTLLEKGKEIFSNVISGIGSAIGTIGETLAGIATAIGGWVTEHGGELLTAGQNLLNWVISGIKTFIGNIPDAIAGIITAITGWVSSNSGSLLAIGQTILSWIIAGIKAFIGNIVNGIKDMVSKFTGWVSGNSQALTDVGTSILDWIISGIADFIGNIVDGFANFMSTLWTWIQGIGTALKNIGKTVIERIKDGIKEKIESIKDAFTGVLTAIREKFTGMAEGLKGIGGKIVDGIKAGITGISSIAEKISDVIKGAISNATSTTYQANVKIAAQTGYKKGSEGDLPQAKALHKPYLFNRSTIFGKYGGDNLVAGEAGAEMLLGVHTLQNLMYSSVQGGMNSIMGQMYDMMSGMQGGGGNSALEAQILDVLQRYLPGIADRQVVLDTGAIAGAVAPGVNAALGMQVGDRRRYSA